MIHSLFKDDAICQYAYRGKKHIVSQLISIASNTTSLNTTYDSSDDDPLHCLHLGSHTILKLIEIRRIVCYVAGDSYDTTAIGLLDQRQVGDDETITKLNDNGTSTI